MGSPERDAINRAYQETMTIILTVAVCIAVPLVPLSFCMGNYRLDEVSCAFPRLLFDVGADGSAMLIMLNR